MKPLIVRIICGVAGALLALVSVVVSLGAAIGAPFGMYFVARWARRRGRETGRLALLFGAVAASSVFAAIVWGAIFALLPQPTQKQLDTAVAEQQTTQAKLPEWYTKMFPKVATARTDSASEKLMRSPQFMKTALVMGAAMVGGFLGVIGGSLTWCAAILLSLARASP